MIEFDPGDGYGEMKLVKVLDLQMYSFPECTFSAPTPDTGDDSNPFLWAGIMLLGLAGIAVVMKQDHSRKQKRQT